MTLLLLDGVPIGGYPSPEEAEKGIQADLILGRATGLTRDRYTMEETAA